MTAADDKIQECLDKRQSFLLDAGAGSGKTYSLVKALNYIRGGVRSELVRNSQKVACITFTNVAKDEIIERTEHDPLFVVSTIHDFLWSELRAFQKEMKFAVATLNAMLPNSSSRKKDASELSDALAKCERLKYSDRGANYLEGRIFHDDLLEIALIMFQSYAMLSRIVAARYPFILVDEYQDTSDKVISILLSHVLKTETPPVIGFFGDKWQSIYSNVVGEIPDDLREGLVPIQKEENYRCSIAVISLLNKIRTDIEQKPAAENLPGSAVYINLNGIGDVNDAISNARKIVRDEFGWADVDGDAKLLFLTHRLISRRAGYEELWMAYHERGRFYRDRFQSGEDEIARYFCDKCEPLIDAWRSRKAGRAVSILNEMETIIAGADEKEHVSTALDRLVEISDGEVTIKEVLVFLQETGLVSLPDDLEYWMRESVKHGNENDEEGERERSFFEKLFIVPYEQVRAYRNILENNLPYSTKHGVKGAEFDTVFVVLDDAGANWNQYSFGKFLAGFDTRQNRFLRTRNLFYVCCSRSKNKLAVIDLGSASGKENAIKCIFGDDACVI